MGLVPEDRGSRASCVLFVMTKVPYVDPPQLNTIRHKKFRTQQVLFRAVPSEYLRERDISNFRTMVQKFRFRQTTVQIVYVRNPDILLYPEIQIPLYPRKLQVLVDPDPWPKGHSESYW